jgi:hypothetical protein
VRHVAVDIVTGFLGSGKTTLLRHVLEHGLKGKPVALIVNEIGEVGIDGQVVTGLNYVEKMVELSSGCICCSIDEYRFDLAIQEIIETVHPHLIVIESTGLADPEPLTYRVKAAGLNLDAVITVVDAVNVERFLNGESLHPDFDGHANCFIETGFHKALLIDFNYETEPLPGHFPTPLGLPLLRESRLNHLGKLLFQWVYWHALLPGRELPGIGPAMPTAGKRAAPAHV